VALSKAYLKRLPSMVEDPKHLEAIQDFLAIFGHEMKASRMKIVGPGIRYSGTIGIATFYTLKSKYKCRVKTSVDRKRFMNDKNFEGSRKSAERFALGNKLASKLYGMVKEEEKVYKLFCFLKKKAIGLLKEGKTVLEAEVLLMDYLKSFGLGKEECIQAPGENYKFSHRSLDPSPWLGTGFKEAEGAKENAKEYPKLERETETETVGESFKNAFLEEHQKKKVYTT
jgi:hypothetical protein